MITITPKPSDVSFWSLTPPFGDDDYGFFHVADTESPHFLSGVLLIFIHGINSNARVCWESLPQYVLSELVTDVDVLSFQYPAGIVSNTSIQAAAQGLHTLISELVLRMRYKELIFVAHSAGGLVVKQMLVLDFNARREVLKRTQKIFNFGVPHAGSTSGLSEWSRKALVLLGYLCYPFARCLRFVSQGSF